MRPHSIPAPRPSAFSSLVAPLVLCVLSVCGAGSADAGDARLRSRVIAALSERDDSERARALEDALRGARGADSATLVAKTALRRAGSERDRAICVAALGRMESDEAVREIAKHARGRAEAAVRADLATALGRVASALARDELRALAVDSDERVRAAAVLALGQCPGPEALAALGPALDDPAHGVRLSAVRALGSHEDPLGLRVLVEALRGAEGRMADDLAEVLARRTGERLGADAAAYERLLHERAGGDAIDIEPSSAPPFDVTATLAPLRTGGVLFVLTTSRSMNEPLTAGAAPASVAAGDDDLAEAWAEAETGLDIAKVHLRVLIRSIADGVPFDVATYGDSTAFAFGSLKPASARTRSRAESRIRGLSASGGANLADALRRCFDPRAKDVLGDHTRPDTVVLIGDGQLGKPGETRAAEVLEGVKRAARSRPIRFICVAVGPSDTSVLGTLASTAPSGRVISVP